MDWSLIIVVLLICLSMMVMFHWCMKSLEYVMKLYIDKKYKESPITDNCDSNITSQLATDLFSLKEELSTMKSQLSSLNLNKGITSTRTSSLGGLSGR